MAVGFDDRNVDGECCALTVFTGDFNVAFMEADIFFDNVQAYSASCVVRRIVVDLIETVKYVLYLLLRDSDNLCLKLLSACNPAP